MIKMILATDINGGLGLNNTLPWHILEDLEYFKSVTKGKVVVMGRKTFVSLPFKEGLPDRDNVVVTHNHTFSLPKRVSTIKFWAIEKLLSIMDEPDVWLIGGKSIYEQLFPFVEEVHHTKINASYECDTFIDTNLWENNPDFKIIETVPLCDNVGVNIWRKSYV